MASTIYESSKVTVAEAPEWSAAMISFRGMVDSAEYRKCMELNFELCKKAGIKNWLQNNTDAGVLSVDDQQWVSSNLIPRAAKEVEKIAVVVAKDVFRKFAASHILEKEKGKLNFQYFGNLDEAKAWLLEN
jgi:hypothetical protein